MWGSSTAPQRPAAWQALKARCIARIFASLTGSLAQPSAKTAGMNIPAVVRMGGQKQGHGEAKGASKRRRSLACAVAGDSHIQVSPTSDLSTGSSLRSFGSPSMRSKKSPSVDAMIDAFGKTAPKRRKSSRTSAASAGP